MKQTKLESLLETCVNIAIGFVISLAFWTLVINPYYGFGTKFVQNIEITVAFTVLAIARQYTVRRFFNAALHKAVHVTAKRIYKLRYIP